MRTFVLLLALLPAIPLVLAAEAETPPAPVEDTRAAANETEAEAGNETEEGEEAAAAEEAGREEEDSVAVIEDFIPSTQISEDLSVSFPVDI